jgi:hypothetical protein
MGPQQLQKLSFVRITGARRTNLTAGKAGFNLIKLGDSSGVQTDQLTIESIGAAVHGHSFFLGQYTSVF